MPTSLEAPICLTAHDSGDLVDAIPVLLGFHPVESLVAVLLRRGQVILTARADLGDGAAALAGPLLEAAPAHQADAVALAGYTESPAGLRELVRLAETPMLPRVIELLHITKDRWWSLPHEIGGPVGCGRFAAEAAYQGIKVVRDREAATAAADGPAASAVAELASRVTLACHATADLDAELRVQRLLGAMSQRRVSRTPLPVAERVQAAVLLLDAAVRGAMWLELTTRRAAEFSRFWGEVVAVAVDEVAGAPLGLLGVAAWLGGNGALLNACYQRAQQVPCPAEIHGLMRAIGTGRIDPATWDQVLRELGKPRRGQ